jgi:PAS domain S-box-containing protein
MLVNLEQLIEAFGDAVIVSDSDGSISFWNPAAEHLFGFTSAEAVGKSLDLIIPERFRERHWSGYAKTMSTGETRYAHDVLRVPALRKDGRPLSIAFTVGLLYDPKRKVVGIVAVIRDDTARFTEERDLHERLAEFEKSSGAQHGVT